MKTHPESFKFIILGSTGLHALQIGDIITKSLLSVGLLGITIDSKLSFKEDFNNIIKDSYYKLYTLRKLRNLLV